MISTMLAVQAVVDPVDLAILAQFYNGTVGTDRWKQGCDTGWLKDPNFCNWRGLTCTLNGDNVKEISIGACNLVGKVPRGKIGSIFALKHLTFVSISSGPDLSLSGNLPDDFNADSPVLKTIQLTGHKLTGQLPQSMFLSSSLQTIDLHSNGLLGTLPRELGALSHLNYFSVAHNSLTGTIPAEVAKLVNLTTLGLARNSFSGDISVVSSLPNLKVLFLRHNSLTGAIAPVSSTVAVYDADYNQFTSIASGLCLDTSKMGAATHPGGCTSDYPEQPFDTCCMAANRFNTAAMRAKCPALRNCFPAPSTCTGQSANLTAADCAAFQALFDATNGTHWTYCADLRHDPCACGFSASVQIGCEPGQGGHIVKLALGNNNLVGSLPSQLGELTALTGLYLGENKLVSTVPPQVSQLTMLETLGLVNNRLSGTLPGALAALTRLTWLDISCNVLEGKVPPMDFWEISRYCVLDNPGGSQWCNPGQGNRFECPLPAGAEQYCHGQCNNASLS